MFTGLVQAVGSIHSTLPTPAGARILLNPNSPRGPWNHQPALGDSISVAGCCLTIAALDRGLWAFDLVPETLARTTLGRLTPGSPVNLEHAVTPNTLLGGHLVQGHIDGLGTVERLDRSDGYRLRIRPPADLMQFLTPKGSIALDGVSLTLAAVDPAAAAFEVALIPTTLELTTLHNLREGSPCNLEADAIAKTAIHWLRHYAGAPDRPGSS